MRKDAIEIANPLLANQILRQANTGKSAYAIERDLGVNRVTIGKLLNRQLPLLDEAKQALSTRLLCASERLIKTAMKPEKLKACSTLQAMTSAGIALDKSAQLLAKSPHGQSITINLELSELRESRCTIELNLAKLEQELANRKASPYISEASTSDALDMPSPGQD